MELRTKIAVALTCLSLTGCNCTCTCVPYPTETVMDGCHKEGRLFVFDNGNSYANFSRGISTVDCSNAKENWIHMPPIFTGGRDPKTGLLP